MSLEDFSSSHLSRPWDTVHHLRAKDDALEGNGGNKGRERGMITLLSRAKANTSLGYFSCPLHHGRKKMAQKGILKPHGRSISRYENSRVRNLPTTQSRVSIQCTSDRLPNVKIPFLAHEPNLNLFEHNQWSGWCQSGFPVPKVNQEVVWIHVSIGSLAFIDPNIRQ